MEALAPYLEKLRELEAAQHSYDGYTLLSPARAHAEVPIFVVAGYIAMVFGIPKLMEHRAAFNLRWLFTFWNLLLAAFSIAGTYYVAPLFLRRLASHGYKSTVCDDPTDWAFHEAAGLWMALFCLSKIPELFDTAFLVLQKKPVIFLHWYHHTTVMLYCWHAYINLIAPGLWFAAMNYFVHAIMYSYYFMMSLSSVTRKMVKPFAKLITSLQLAQMVVGIVVTVSVTVYHHTDAECLVTPSNNKMALAMYGSYFFLFAQLFHRMYISKGGKHNAAARVCSATEESISAGCTADKEAAQATGAAKGKKKPAPQKQQPQPAAKQNGGGKSASPAAKKKK